MMQMLDLSSLPKTLAAAKADMHNLYYTGVPCKHGHDTYRYVKDRACSQCVKLKVKRLSTIGGGNSRRWAKKTSEQLAKIYEKRKTYYAKTVDSRLEKKRRSYAKLSQDPAWMEARRKKVNAYRSEHGRKSEVPNPVVKKRYKQTPNGKAKSRALDAQRRAAKLQRTPRWLTADDFWMLEEAYALAQLRSRMFGFSWHVDHVYPLQGRIVSGLHTPFNVQVIPGIENVRKANRMPA